MFAQFRSSLPVFGLCALVFSGLGLAQPAEALTVTPTPIPTSTEVVNPMRGHFKWRGQEMAPLPRTAFDAYDRYEWATLEPTKDHYDFSAIEDDIETANAQGRKFAFGIRSMVAEQSNVVPSYLKGLMAKGWTDDRGTYVPDFNDPDFLDRASKLLDALGAEYDGDPRVAWIDIRMYGQWGEWHFSGVHTDQAPSGWAKGTLATKQAIVDMHVSAFPTTQLIMMSDDDDALVYAMGLPRNIGWRRDSLGHTWFADGIHHTTAKWNAVKDRWQTAPVIGEYYGNNVTDFALAKQQVKDYHVSLVSNGNIGGSTQFSDLTTTQQNDFKESGRNAGYRFVLNSLTIPSPLAKGSAFTVSSSWNNVGVTPTYEDWDVTLQLRVPSTGAIVWEGISGLNLRNFMPGAKSQSDSFTVPTTVPNGTYDLALTVNDPAGHRSPLALAINGVNSFGRYILGQVTLTNAPSPVNLAPVADSYVRDGSYSDDVQGTATELHVKDSPTDAMGFDRRTYLRFNMTSSGISHVSSATLRLYVTSLPNGTGVPLKAYGISDDTWTEAGLTWDNRPTSPDYISTSTANAVGWLDVDVTSWVNSELAGDKVASVMIYDNTAANKLVAFESRESTSGHTPYLTLVP